METLKKLHQLLEASIAAGLGVLSPTHVGTLKEMRKQVQKRIDAALKEQQ